MRGLPAGTLLAMLDLAVEVRQVLVQRPPEGHVEHLHAAADAEHGHPQPDGGARQLELEAVELRLGRAQLGVRQRAVGGWMEVGAPGEHDGVEVPQQGADRVGRHRGEDDGHATGRANRVQVALTQRELGAGRLALGHELAVPGRAHLGGRDADEWRRAYHSTHVSFPPPRCELLTTNAPGSSATRVRPPGTTDASPP